MKPADFTYHRATSVDQAVALLGEHGPDAKILAGGQSLVPLMNFRLARPGVVVDVNPIPDLSYVRKANGGLVLGALTRQRTVEQSTTVAAECPLLAEATGFIGHATIRNRGTIGGSLAHGDPSAEFPTVVTALDAEVTVRGPAGERRIPAGELFVAYGITTIAEDEMLTEIELPRLAPGTGWAFEELSRRHGDYALVGVAAQLTLDADGTCTAARLAVGGVGATPLRCAEAESALTGNRPDESTLAAAADQAAAIAEPVDDMHASAAYKREMVRVFVERALARARERTGRW